MMKEQMPSFPPELHNSCQLMVSHGGFRRGAWHLLEAAEKRAVVKNNGHQAVNFDQDVQCICAHLNHLLVESRLASDRLPTTASNLFDNLRDGVILCALANSIRSGVIADGAVIQAPATDAQIQRNLNLAICSLENLGVCVSGLTASCLREADPPVYVGILLQTLRRCLLQNSAAEAALIRWVMDSTHCVASNAVDLPRILNSPTHYAKLVSAAIAHGSTPPGVKGKDELKAMKSDLSRAQLVAHNAACLGLEGLIAPEHLVTAKVAASDEAAALRKHFLCLLFIARLYRLKKAPLSMSNTEASQTSKEESTLVMWINSLGVEPLVNRLGVDLRSGSVLLQAWEVLSPGSINWSTVVLTGDLAAAEDTEKAPRAETEAAWLTNCVQVIECARLHGVSVDMSAAEALVAGDLLTTAALVNSMMRLHSLMQLKRVITGCDIATPASVAADIIGWANMQLTTFGANFKLVGVDDPNLKATNALGYLGERVLAKTGHSSATVQSVRAASLTSGVGAASVRIGSGGATTRSPSMRTSTAVKSPATTNANANANDKDGAEVPLVNANAKAAKKPAAKGAEAAEAPDSGEAEATKPAPSQGGKAKKAPATAHKAEKPKPAAKKTAPSEAKEDAEAEEDADEETAEHKDAKAAKPVKAGKAAKAPQGKPAKPNKAEKVEAEDAEVEADEEEAADPKPKVAKGAKKGAAKSAAEVDAAEAEAAHPKAKGATGAKKVAGKPAAEAEDEDGGASKAKHAKGAKKGPAKPAAETDAADAEAAHTKSKGATGAKKVSGKPVAGAHADSKHHKAKGAKAAGKEAEASDDSEETEEPKASSKGAKAKKEVQPDKKKSSKGAPAKGAAAEAENDEAAEDEEEAEAAPKSPKKPPAKPAGKKAVNKGKKDVKAKPDQGKDADEEGEQPDEDAEEAAGKGAKNSHAVKPVKKTPKVKNANAATSASGRTVKPAGLKGKSSKVIRRAAVNGAQSLTPESEHAGAEHLRPVFQRVSQLTLGEQTAEYSRLTLDLFSQCGLSVFAHQLGPDTDAAVYLDILMQLRCLSYLSESRGEQQ